MTYRLKKLSSLLILLMLLTSKPVQAFEYLIMFALPFLGAITQESQQRPTLDEQYGAYSQHFGTLDYIRVGKCKVYTQQTQGNGTVNGRACKQ